MKHIERKCMTHGAWLALAFLCLDAAASAQSFHSDVLYPTQNGPLALATGDFNGDGKPDLAVGNGASSSVSIFLAKGDGTFNAGAIVPVSGNCLVSSLTAADFTGDGKIDLLVVCGFQSAIWVLPGLGPGQFAPGISTPLQQVVLMGFIPPNFQGVAVADFNGDGKLDLALDLANPDLTSPAVAVLLGNGNGTFQAPSPVGTTGVPTNLVAADMNLDGKPDLVVALSPPAGLASLLVILLGNGTGGFQQAASDNLSTDELFNGYMLVADVNRDGIPDVVVAGEAAASIGTQNPSSTLSVFTGQGNGTLAPGFSAAEPNLIFGLLAADFRRTGTPDLVEVTGGAGFMAGSGPLLLSTRAGNGDGTFQNPVANPTSSGVVPWWFGLVSADWNADGLPDLAFISSPSLLTLGSASGSGLAAVIHAYDAFAAGNLVVQLNAATPSVPSVVSLNPVVSTGSTESFTFQFSDSSGYQSLQVIDILINNALDGNQACYIAYVVPANTLYLVPDNGAGLLPGVVLNGSGSTGNHQCTVSGAGSSASVNGNMLTLVLNVTFSDSFGGNKVVYAAAREAVNNSGWQILGLHGVPPLPATFPNPTGMSPPYGNTLTSTITFNYQDQSSAGNFQTVWALINTAIDAHAACYVAYYRPGNLLFLYPDNGDGSQAAYIPLTGNNTIANSQCGISAQGASVQSNGATLSVTLPITFTTGFAGPKGVWLAAETISGALSAWQAIGQWIVP